MSFHKRKKDRGRIIVRIMRQHDLTRYTGKVTTVTSAILLDDNLITIIELVNAL